MKKTIANRSHRLSVRKNVVPCQPLKRVNYFTGQLLLANDFTAEQDYHLEKHRRHNRLCHGFGVVQGLKVSVANNTAGPTVIVDPGFAFDPFGNEIQLCSQVRLQLRELQTPIYVLIRFAENPTDPVPTIPAPTGGEDGGVEYARVEEGCEVLLDPNASLPDTGSNPQGKRCSPAALPLARLVRKGKAWQMDRKFKTARAH